MSGLFEHLAADDEMGRIARRKAIAVAIDYDMYCSEPIHIFKQFK